MQHRTAERIYVATQLAGETVELVRSMRQGLKTKMSFRNGFPRGFLNGAELSNVLQERISERMHDKISREYLQRGFQFVEVPDDCEAEKRC